MDWLTSPALWAALVTLTLLEIVLGFDNIIMVSILSDKLPTHKQARARTLGLAGAMLTRIALLRSLVWITQLTAPLFTVFSLAISGRDIILITGGLFLLGKSTCEILNKIEGSSHEAKQMRSYPSVVGTVAQIMLLDVVFSFDSVITAIGMANQITVMIAAIVIAVGFMMLSAAAISTFIDKYPTVKLLALSFLLLIGMMLVAEGLGQHISKGYIYFGMGFSLFVEGLNIRMRKRQAGG